MISVEFILFSVVFFLLLFIRLLARRSIANRPDIPQRPVLRLPIGALLASTFPTERVLVLLLLVRFFLRECYKKHVKRMLLCYFIHLLHFSVGRNSVR